MARFVFAHYSEIPQDGRFGSKFSDPRPSYAWCFYVGVAFWGVWENELNLMAPQIFLPPPTKILPPHCPPSKKKTWWQGGGTFPLKNTMILWGGTLFPIETPFGLPTRPILWEGGDFAVNLFVSRSMSLQSTCKKAFYSLTEKTKNSRKMEALLQTLFSSVYLKAIQKYSIAK